MTNMRTNLNTAQMIDTGRIDFANNGHSQHRANVLILDVRGITALGNLEAFFAIQRVYFGDVRRRSHDHLTSWKTSSVYGAPPSALPPLPLTMGTSIPITRRDSYTHYHHNPRQTLKRELMHSPNKTNVTSGAVAQPQQKEVLPVKKRCVTSRIFVRPRMQWRHPWEENMIPTE